MTVEASNALLKTLEEPPENSFLILIVSSPEHLFPTVTSRCQMVRFLPLQSKKAEEKLPSEEKVKMLDILGMASSGSTIGEGILMAERVMEITDYFKKEMEKKAAKEISGLTETFSKATIKELKEKSEADISGKVQAKLLRMLDIVLSWYRDVLVLKAGGKKLLINPDRINELQSAGKSFSAPSLIRIMEEIEKTKEMISRNVSPRLAIEVMMIRIIEELKQ
jgi:DNA polymerase-3 subunit delta'